MGQHIIPINVKFDTGSRSVPPCQISRISGQKYGNIVPKTVKIWNFARKFVPEGRLVCTIFYEILIVCRPTRLYRSLLSYFLI